MRPPRKQNAKRLHPLLDQQETCLPARPPVPSSCSCKWSGRFWAWIPMQPPAAQKQPPLQSFRAPAKSNTNSPLCILICTEVHPSFSFLLRTDPGRCFGNKDREGSREENPSSWEEEHPRWPVPPLAQEGSPRDERESDSICTEDFAAAFYECLVDPLQSDKKEESDLGLAVGFPEYIPGSWDEKPAPSQFFVDFPAALGPHFGGSVRELAQPPKEASKGKPGRVSPLRSPEESPFLPRRPKRHSPESTGEKSSKLSQRFPGGACRANNSLWDVSPRERSLGQKPAEQGEKPRDCPRISSERGLGCERRKGSLACIPGPREHSSSPLLVEDLGPWEPFGAADAAGAKTTVSGEQVPRRAMGYGLPEKGLHAWRTCDQSLRAC